jgi:hypothetical protein
MAASTKARRGKDTKAQWGSTVLGVKNFTLTYRGDDLDTSNTLSGGHEEGLVGFDVVEFSLEMDWDAGKNPLDDPPGIYVRDDGGPLKIWENVTDNTFWLLPVVRILSCVNSGPVKGLVSFNVTGKSNGTFTRPTGSV